MSIRCRTLLSFACVLFLAAAPPATRTRLDRNGHPLPPGALARLGSPRLQQCRGVRTVAFSPDGKTLAVASDSRPLIFWRVATGGRRHHLKRMEAGGWRPDSFAGTDLHFSPDGKLLGGEDRGCACVWDAASGKRLWIHHVDAGVSAIAFSPDSKILAGGTGIWNNTNPPIVLWNSSTGREIRRFPGPKWSLSQLVFSADGKTLTSFYPPRSIPVDGKDKTILGAVEVWDVRTGKRLARKEDGSLGVLFPDGKRYTRIVKDGRLEIRELTKTKPLRILDAGDPRHIVSPDGKLLAGMDKQCIRIWNTDTGRLIHRLQGDREADLETSPDFPLHYFPLAFSPDGKLLATGSCNDGNHAGAVRLWDLAKGKEVLLAEDHYAAITCLALAADGKTAVSGSKDRSVRIWDTATGKPLGCLTGHTGLINAVALSPTGALVASSSQDKTVRLWEAATGRLRHSLKAEAWVVSLSFLPDGKTLQVCDLEGGIRWYDVGSGKLRRQARDERDGFGSISFGTSGISLVRPSTPGRFDWRKLLSKPVYQQEEANPEVWGGFSPSSTVHVSADGRLAATVRQTVSGGLSGPRWQICVREVATGGLVADLEELGVMPCSLAFSGDGWGLFTGLGDWWDHGSAILGWDLVRQKPAHRFTDGESNIVALALSPDGTKLASGTSDATMLIWDVSSLFQPGRLPPLNKPELELYWAALAGANARAAYRSMYRLAASPTQSVPFLRRQLLALRPVEAKQIRKLIADLDDEAFAVRDKASKELERLRERIEPELRAALKEASSLEARTRIRAILGKLSASGVVQMRLRILRAISVLERCRTTEARQVLRELAKAAPDALLGKEAEAALERSTWKQIRRDLGALR